MSTAADIEALEQRIEALEERVCQLGLVREMIDEASNRQSYRYDELHDATVRALEGLAEDDTPPPSAPRHRARGRLHVIAGGAQR